MSDEIIKPPNTSDNSLAPALSYISNKIKVQFDGDCLKQDNYIYSWENRKYIHRLWNKFFMMIILYKKIIYLVQPN